MDEGDQKDPPNNLDNSAEARALQGIFQTPTPRAYTQPNSFPSQPEPVFPPLYSPSPSAVFPSPGPFVNNNSGQQFTFSALNYHHGTAGGRPTPPQPFPFTPGPLSSTPGPVASTPQPEDASITKKTQTQAQEKPVTSKKGKGARSGKNARSGGHSDTEIKALDEKSKKAADIVLPAKWDDASALKLIEFITSPERWDKVATSLNKICQDASQILFDNKYTVTQCNNKWQNVFRMYKAAKRYLNHTGGGDGDEDQGVDSMDSDSGDDTDGDKKAGGRKKKGQQYSPATMIAFSEGPLYPLILCVADGRADIDRPIEFSSHRKPEEIDGDVKKTSKKRKKSDAGDLQEVLSEALRSVKTQQQETALREGERFTYEKRRDDRREQQETERLELEREKMMIERLGVELRQKRELEDIRFTKLERYRAMRDSADPLEQAFARKLADEIRAEQGLL